jgi:5'-3' exonuclease
MNRLVLIDGNAILHRAYHALPPLTAPDGSLVNAVYGFTTMLFRIFNDLRPTHIAVCFDRPKPTFRKKLFKGYQAKRPKMDQELAGQIEKVHEVIRAFGLPIFEKDGFEADDVIGTLARIATRDMQHVTRKTKKISDISHVTSHVSPFIDQTIIVTGDKDILQLVNDHTYAYMPTKGLSEAKLYMDKDVVERMGVIPKLIPDLKGLMGDASDNYPGVEGIGPKTAVDLLQKFGTIEKLYQWIDKYSKNHESGIMNHGKDNEISETVLQKLISGKKSAELSKDLATIRTNVLLDETLEKAHVITLDTPQARKVLGDLHFHSLLKRLEGEKNSSFSQATEGKQKKRDTVKTGQQQQLF